MKFFTGANTVSLLVLVSFTVLSFLAMKPETAGVNKDVVLYLLGAWQSLAAGVVLYHVGSSASSARKDAQIEAATAATVDAAKVATATTVTAAAVAADVVKAAADAKAP